MAASSAVYAGVSQTCARSISMVRMFGTAFSMIPSATAILARPIARAAPLQLAAVGCCGAATLGMTGALDMQDPYMWGRHDRRTRKGKIHVGTYGKVRPRKPDATPFSQEYWGRKILWLPPGGGTSSPPRTGPA